MIRGQKRELVWVRASNLSFDTTTVAEVLVVDNDWERQATAGNFEKGCTLARIFLWIATAYSDSLPATTGSTVEWAVYKTDESEASTQTVANWLNNDILDFGLKTLPEGVGAATGAATQSVWAGNTNWFRDIRTRRKMTSADEIRLNFSFDATLVGIQYSYSALLVLP